MKLILSLLLSVPLLCQITPPPGGGGGGTPPAGSNGDLQMKNNAALAASAANDNGSTLFNIFGRKVGIGDASFTPTHQLHISTNINDAFGVDSTGTDSASMGHIKNIGEQGPFFDFWGAAQRWAWGVASGGSFNLRNSAVGTDPVNGTTQLAVDTSGNVSIPIGTLSVGGTVLTGTSETISGLGWPAITITQGGTPATTSYTYCIVGSDSLGNNRTICRTTDLGPVTLNGTDYNIPTIAAWTGTVVPVGACDVYRKSGGATQGKIGTIASCASGGNLHDTGLAGDSASPPDNTSGNLTSPIITSIRQLATLAFAGFGGTDVYGFTVPDFTNPFGALQLGAFNGPVATDAFGSGYLQALTTVVFPETVKYPATILSIAVAS